MSLTQTYPQVHFFTRSLNARHWRALLGSVCSIALAVLALAAWRHLAPPQAAAGWRYEPYQDDVEKVSALAFDGQGELLLSQELQNGQGRILKRSADGSLSEVELGLSKPDGMTSFRGGVLFSQEQDEEPVLWYTPDGTRSLFSGRNIEGLANDGRYLYAIEDRHGDGRLLRYDPQSDTTLVLRSDLDEAEAITACPDGRLFYSEKTKGQVFQLLSEGQDRLVLDGLNQPGFLLCSADGLWITEDATHMARLLLLSEDGRLQTVLSHLRSAQSILQSAAGQYLLAEQGRNRVLRLQRRKTGN
ncbi:hypothetical protein AAFN46_01215 [Pseudomonas sp. CAU 1711]|uniref:hypothetical protein n=1 Tax=Pseudomonas sp. CAU 1711 TaxID=3140356 RepID=UPI00326022D1